MLVSQDRNCRIDSMFRQISRPTKNPVSVPTTPIAAPVIRNIRMIEPCEAPMVRRIAMSLPLSFTSMIRPETMLSAATSTIMVRIRNITLRSTCSALKKVELRCRQSTRNTGRPAASVTRLAEGVDLVGIGGEHLDRGDVVVAVEIGLRFRQRHEHEARVIFRHADLEHRGDLVGLDARRRAHRGHRALRRHQRDAVAGMQRQLIGEPAADRDALPLVKALRACPA